MAFRTLGEIVPPPAPERVRAAFALLPNDEPTRLLEHCLRLRGVTLAAAIAMLSEARDRASAIESIVSTSAQLWTAARTRNALTLGEREQLHADAPPILGEETPLERG